MKEQEIQFANEKEIYLKEIMKLKEEVHVLKYYYHNQLPIGIGLSKATESIPASLTISSNKINNSLIGDKQVDLIHNLQVNSNNDNYSIV